jgi:prophage regulatory protein
LSEISTSSSATKPRRRPRLRDDTPALVEQSADAIIRESECQQLTRLSRATRWRLERAGLFPRKRQLSPGCKGWLRSEVQQWIAERAAI